MEQAQILRIVVASPGDVRPERDAVERVATELNRGIAKERGLRLEVVRWETDTYPGFHLEGPQGLINPLLRIEDCDVLIGIFWKRFGTKTADGTTGTEHEFRTAYEAWKKARRPHIMVYFNQKAHTPTSKAETEQWGRVLEFKENFPKEGLSWDYNGEDEFEDLVRNHLTQWILRPVTPSEECSEPVLPTVSPHFTGRDAAVAEALERLERERIVTITGLGGIGKSEVAKAAAHAAVGREWAAEGVLYVDLQAANSANAVQGALVTGLRLQPAGDAEAVARQMGGHRLYVLDDLYQALVSDGKNVRALVRALHDFADPARFLLTCREPVGVAGLESRLPLDRLAPPHDADLFRKLAGFHNYEWHDGDEARLGELLRGLDGYPLALTLAASGLEDGGTLESVLRRWRNRRTAALRVPGIEDGDLDRLSSVDFSLALSFDRLPENSPARLLFALFADLPAGATGETLEAMLGEDGHDAASLLTRRSLVQIGDDGRYLMLVPVRHFAARTATDACEPLRQKLDAHLLALAEHWCGDDSVWISDMGESVCLLSAEQVNLHAAMDRAQARGDNVFIANLTGALIRFYEFALPGAEAKQRLQHGGTAAHAIGDVRREADCIFSLGNVHQFLGEYELTRQCYDNALPLYQSIGDRQGEANCIKYLGDVHQSLAEYNRARERYEQALSLYQSIGDRLGEANCIQRLGFVHIALAEYGLARERNEQALPLYQSIGDRRGEAGCLWGLGDVHQVFSEYELARQRYEQALPLFQSIGDRYSIAGTFWRIGELCAAEGHREEAAGWMEQAARLYEEIGVTHWAGKVREQAEGWRT